MERHRPSAARTRVRSLRPPRGGRTAAASPAGRPAGVRSRRRQRGRAALAAVGAFEADEPPAEGEVGPRRAGSAVAAAERSLPGAGTDEATEAVGRKALRVIAELTAAQQDPALALLAIAVQGSSATTYGEWARLFLTTIGAPACQNNLTAVVAWQAAEYTQAGWNPCRRRRSRSAPARPRTGTAGSS